MSSLLKKKKEIAQVYVTRKHCMCSIKMSKPRICMELSSFEGENVHVMYQTMVLDTIQ